MSANLLHRDGKLILGTKGSNTARMGLRKKSKDVRHQRGRRLGCLMRSDVREFRPLPIQNRLGAVMTLAAQTWRAYNRELEILFTEPYGASDFASLSKTTQET